MKEQINDAIEWLKLQNVDGCITGSCLLDYFEGQDVDVFVYNESSFTKLLYSMYFNPRFLLIEKLEEWKFKEWTTKDYKKSLKKMGLVTIKFKYNTCIDVNVIYKEKSKSIFDVLSTFDLNIICKGFDLKTKKILDLTDNPGKIADYNKWNLNFESPDIWSISRLLRQFMRVIKYHERGYNTDKVVLKYKSIIEDLMQFENIYNSVLVDQKVDNIKTNGKILIAIMDKWLENHSITDEEKTLLNNKIKEI